MDTYFKRLSTALLLCISFITLGAVPSKANDQTWVLGFWNIHRENFLYKDSNSFFRYAEDKTFNTYNISGIFPNRSYLEWYLWGKQGLGLTYIEVGEDSDMNTSGDTPFEPEFDSSGDSRSPNAWFNMSSLMLTLPRIWYGEEGYWRVGTVAGAGLSKYSMTAPENAYGKDKTFETYGLAFMAGAFLDWGGDGFGARVGFTAVSAWHRHLEYNGWKMNVDTHYISRYLDLRWAW